MGQLTTCSRHTAEDVMGKQCTAYLMHKTLQNTGAIIRFTTPGKVCWCCEHYRCVNSGLYITFFFTTGQFVMETDKKDRREHLFPNHQQVNTADTFITYHAPLNLHSVNIYSVCMSKKALSWKVETQTPHLFRHCGGLSKGLNYQLESCPFHTYSSFILVWAESNPCDILSQPPSQNTMNLASWGQSGQYESGQLWFVCPAPLSYWTTGQ